MWNPIHRTDLNRKRGYTYLCHPTPTPHHFCPIIKVPDVPGAIYLPILSSNANPYSLSLSLSRTKHPSIRHTRAKTLRCSEITSPPPLYRNNGICKFQKPVQRVEDGGYLTFPLVYIFAGNRQYRTPFWFQIEQTGIPPPVPGTSIPTQVRIRTCRGDPATVL
jgi:hypothetical protein